MGILQKLGGQLWLQSGLGVGVATLSATRTLNGTSAQFQSLTASGADRNVVFPALGGNGAGQWFVVRNAGASNNVVCKKSDGSTTIATLAPGQWAIIVSGKVSGVLDWYVLADAVSLVSLTLTGALTAVGITNNSTLDQNGNIDHDTTQAASGAGLDTLTQVSSATGSPDAVVVGLTQITNNRTAGTATAVDITVTGRAGDTSGGTYEGIRGTFAASGGSAVSIFAKVAAGWSRLLDLTDVATGEADVVVKDNLADAFGIREAANYYLKVVTTTGAQLLEFAKPVKLSGGVAAGSIFQSTEQTANGSPQNIAHGLGRTPTKVWWAVSDSGATGIYTLVPGAPDGTNVVMNGTAGVKYYVWAV